MFKNLLNFSYKRTAVEAIGFYISYLIVLIIISIISAALLGLVINTQNSFEFGARIGTFFAIVTCLVLSFTILKKKRLLNNFIYLIIALLSGVLAFLGGGLLGLIPTAFLTTRKK